MNILFIGTSEFAVSPLDVLLKKGFNIVSVITQPDKFGGRGLKKILSPVKIFALESNLPIFQPHDINSKDVENLIKSREIDLGIVVSYAQIINENIFSLPKFHMINLHPSLLPKYRGPSPIQSALLNDDKKTGVTVIEINKRMDAGPIISQKEVDISPFDDYVTLHSRLSFIGGELLAESVAKFPDNIRKIDQNESDATYCRLFDKSDGKIDWEDTAHNIANKVKALSGWPIAYTYFRGKLLKIYKAEVTQEFSNIQFGSMIKLSKESFGIVAGDGVVLKILELQIEGKSKVDSKAFMNGNKFDTGDKL